MLDFHLYKIRPNLTILYEKSTIKDLWFIFFNCSKHVGNNEQRIYADDKDVIPVCLQRTSDGFGFNFVGPETTDSMTGLACIKF